MGLAIGQRVSFSTAEHCDTLAHAKMETGIKIGRLSGPTSVLFFPSPPVRRFFLAALLFHLSHFFLPAPQSQSFSD